MVRQRCLKCGKLKELANATTCVNCLNKIEPFIKEIKFNRLQICKACNAYSYSKQWHYDIKDKKINQKQIESLIKSTIKKGLKINRVYSLKKLEIKLEKLEKESTEKKEVYLAHLRLRLFEQKTFQYSKTIRFILIHSICPKCQKHMSDYFEGIIQLRGRDCENYNEAEAELKNLIKKHKDVEISKIVKSKHGIDFYVTNKRIMQEVSKKIFEKYGGHFEQNSQLFSYNHQSSKAIYRVNALIRLPDFNKYDILDIKNTNLLVKKIHGKKVTGIDLKTNKERQFDFEKNTYSIAFKREDIKFKTTVSKTYPDFEILDDNYQSVTAENISEKRKELKPGSKITVIKFNKKYFII